MKKMDKKAVTMAFEEIVYWPRAILVLVILLTLAYLIWVKLNLGLGFIKGLF